MNRNAGHREYTVTNSNYGKIYKNKGMIEIDQECSGIARIVEAEVQQAHIPDEYEIQFGKTQEIGSTKPSNITKIKGRIFNGSEWKNQEILIQTGATANHIKGILIEGIHIYEGKQYTYQTFEGNNFSCKNMVDLLIQLDTIRITVPCYITNHESDQDLILGNLFLNKLEDYSIGKMASK
ncbi:hypothetical protein H5410_053045 [Solanum commersonii]|uniref:Uncharacterized protein n=1 Tax=Solanum commersonii TaxID=4109 RepID=A0A9J5X398_SOLCO|nr:hypothetical protein H5410_053045 [Solanum commersonii]